VISKIYPPRVPVPEFIVVYVILCCRVAVQIVHLAFAVLHPKKGRGERSRLRSRCDVKKHLSKFQESTYVE
jgi:hypothetical protein